MAPEIGEICSKTLFVILETGSKYIGYVTTTCGTKRHVYKSVVLYQYQRSISLDELVAIRYNDTLHNRGLKKVTIRNLETTIWGTLQWYICLLHFFELSFILCLFLFSTDWECSLWTFAKVKLFGRNFFLKNFAL